MRKTGKLFITRLESLGIKTVLLLTLLITPVFAQALIETSVSSSRVAVGQQFTLDIIVSEAQGQISTPKFPPLDGFNSYSQGRSQEITIVNGRTTSRSIFTYVLVPNSTGTKKIGPFEIVIDGTRFEAAAVEIEVVDAAAGSAQWAQRAYYSQSAPAVQPPSRALPATVNNQDIFVKAWLDKDEVYINEPVTLTYTLYTRLSATYRGFEKEPVTTGFWVEDFPPGKTIRKQEQLFNGSRYVVAEVRKIALFPTQAGVFTIDTGTLSANVELRNQDDFDNFFSYNIFGYRRSSMPSVITTQIVSRDLQTDPVVVTVKALPESGRPAEFTGAVGQFEIESSLDKNRTEQGTPVTYRVRVRGRGNINTIQIPELRVSSDLKVYDASTSVNISKDRLIVEGEKVVDTVIVPRKSGTFTIPELAFAYFDPQTGEYKTIRAAKQDLKVDPLDPGDVNPPPAEYAGPAEASKAALKVLDQDIHYLKKPPYPFEIAQLQLTRRAGYWFALAVLLFASGLLYGLGSRSALRSDGSLASRRKHAASTALARLRRAKKHLSVEQADTFFADVYQAVYGYFSDKFGLALGNVNADSVVAVLDDKEAPPALVNDARSLFEELGYGRFSRTDKDSEHMQDVLSKAREIIASVERMK